MKSSSVRTNNYEVATCDYYQILFARFFRKDFHGGQRVGQISTKAALQHHLYFELPVFIYSTSSSERDKQIAASLGANGFFTKPERFEEVKKIVKVLLMYVRKN